MSTLHQLDFSCAQLVLWRPGGARPGHVVLDPCCGAGTLLIEA